MGDRDSIGVVSAAVIFSAIVILGLVEALYVEMLVTFILEGRVLTGVVLLVLGFAVVLGAVAYSRYESWESSISEATWSEGFDNITLIAVVLIGIAVWFVAFNFLLLMALITGFEFASVGDHHADRFNLATDLIGLLYAIAGLSLLLWLPIFVWRNWLKDWLTEE